MPTLDSSHELALGKTTDTITLPARDNEPIVALRKGVQIHNELGGVISRRDLIAKLGRLEVSRVVRGDLSHRYARRIRFSFRRKSPPSRRTQEGLVFQAATLTEYPNGFSAEALRFQEGQQVGVNGIGLGCGHAVRKALVGFQCAIL